MNIPARIAALTAMALLVTGCQGIPDQPVPTLGQKLGIPQAFAGARDAFLNRSGDRPWKEWKPPLKRLADAANLAPEMPKPIQMAAEIKMKEDLAEQQIKGLKYLGLMGCNCYDEGGKMAEAFLEALKDCNPCVRLAAIEALETSANECDRRAKRFNKVRERCVRGNNRPGLGCQTCNIAGGAGIVSDCACDGCSSGVVGGYGSCDGGCGSAACSGCIGTGQIGFQGPSGCSGCSGGGCAVCGSCLNKDICKRLEEMANKQDDDGCWLEPIEEIRAAAQRLLGRCQVYPEVQRNGGQQIERENGSGETVPDPDADDATTSANRSPNQLPSDYYSMGDGRTREVSFQRDVQGEKNRMFGGFVSIGEGREISIELDDAYLLPVTSKIVLRDSGGHDYEYQVESSAAGTLVAHPTSEIALDLSEREYVQIGVLAK